MFPIDGNQSLHFCHHQHIGWRSYCRSVGTLFSYAELWLEVGVTLSRTTGLFESIIRQVGRRTKKIEVSWSDDGMEKMVKLFRKKTCESSDWEQYWKNRMSIKKGCKITFLSVDLEITAASRT